MFEHQIASLKAGNAVEFRPRGSSMEPKIHSGERVCVEPLGDRAICVGDVVLCKVSGHTYLHLVSAISSDGRCQISNNKGRVNGWCSRDSIYGVLTALLDRQSPK